MRTTFERQITPPALGRAFDRELFDEFIVLLSRYASDASETWLYAEQVGASLRVDSTSDLSEAIAANTRPLRAAHLFFSDHVNDRWSHVWWRPDDSDFGSGATFQNSDVAELAEITDAADVIFNAAAVRAAASAPATRDRMWQRLADSPTVVMVASILVAVAVLALAAAMPNW